MGRRQRRQFRDELRKLVKIEEDESPEFAAQDRPLTHAHRQLHTVERIWIYARSRDLRSVDGWWP